ncbi:hypothetical protein [Bacillus canaveralius]|uniref:hypothetical protein n=1 Tax=Bacillus canaveralius TaxID=1403243 RepID=UPI000F7670C4|nr:hypothetical protein [Bacillus canaveralius]RSK52909.1 hypothetical protein EJA13_09605 [Bacillus canaveralius]
MSLFSTANFSDSFFFKDKKFSYNKIPINNISERAIEVPIGLDFLEQNKTGRILEVGHVLSSYETAANIVQRDILDKFEVAANVLNLDLMDFHPENKYDAIISISTVEHIGQSTDPTGAYGESSQLKDHEAPLKAIVKIYNLLKVNGKAIISVPFGCLSDLGWLIQFGDKYLQLLFTKYLLPENDVTISFFKKSDMDLSLNNPRQIWEQCTKEELSYTRFNQPFPFANGIAFIEIYRNAPEDYPIENGMKEELIYQPAGLINNLYFSNFFFGSVYDSNGWFQISNPTYLFFGPYITLPAGKYELRAKLEVETEGEFILDVVDDFAKNTLFKYEFQSTSNCEQQVMIEKDLQNVEIRLLAYSPPFSKIRVPILSLNRI